MLRLVRLRLGHRPRTTPAARCLATEPSLRSTVDDTEPYGTAYGSGPSRIPYEPQIQDVPAMFGLKLTTASAALKARRLRRQLADLHHGSFARLGLLLHALYGPDGTDPSSISRLELHTILHRLARNPRTRHVAVDLLLRALDPPSSTSRGARISRTTLRCIFDSHYRLPRFKDDSSAALQPSGPLQQLFDCLTLLERSDNARPTGLYEVIIKRCMAERLPDRAAKLYVELVEEWATTSMIPDEPRVVSEIPPGALAVAERRGVPMSLKSWWKNVRTWPLPGEVLSPLDRQDLWHPRKSAIGKRLRGFPIPSSNSSSFCPPPSMLFDILSGLHIDPKQSNNTDYATSMRALAILANPIFSRTIPVSSLGPLLRTLKMTRRDIPVFPDGLDSVPEGDRWAYEAYTQIHLALQSVLFSPPLSASALQQVEREAIGESEQPTLGLRPLTWRICNILVDYTLKILRQPKILKRLFNHMSEAFGVSARPTLHNRLLQGGAATRQPGLVNWAMQGLFGSNTVSDKQIESPDNEAIVVMDADSLKTESSAVLPDEQSMVALLGYLASVREFEKVERLVYSLFPSLHTKDEFGAPRPQQLDATSAVSSLELSPRMTAAILAALEKAGKVGLAYRVFCLARHVEQQHLADAQISSTRQTRQTRFTPRNHILPIQAYTSMLQIWGSETYGEAKRYTFPIKTLPVLSGRKRLSRYAAAPLMVLRTYEEARERWQAPYTQIQPDERFFLALLSACRHRWMLDDLNALPPDLGRHREELQMVMEDMEQCHVPVPRIIKAKLGLLTLGPTDSKRWSQELVKGMWTRGHKTPRPFAADLAAMQMGWEHELVAGKSDEDIKHLNLASEEELQQIDFPDRLTSTASQPATSAL